MIFIKALNGPHTGKVRDVSSLINPEELLRSMLEHGWTWEINYSQATPEEKFVWGRVDLITRCVRALTQNLPVIFLGKVYDDAGELEDAIVASGRMVSLGRDDEHGVTILAGDREGN